MGTPGHARPDATTEPHTRRDNRRVDLTRPQHDHDANKPHKNLLTRPHSFIHAALRRVRRMRSAPERASPKCRYGTLYNACRDKDGIESLPR